MGVPSTGDYALHDLLARPAQHELAACPCSRDTLKELAGSDLQVYTLERDCQPDILVAMDLSRIARGCARHRVKHAFQSGQISGQ